MMEKIGMFADFSKEIDFTISENEYTSFQVCSKDMNPLHVNGLYAQAHGFKDRVMYGNILNAFVSYVVGMELPTQDVILLAQSIQYKNPVFLNDKLVMNIKTDNISVAVNSVTLVYKFCNSDKKVVAKGNVIIGVME